MKKVKRLISLTVIGIITISTATSFAYERPPEPPEGLFDFKPVTVDVIANENSGIDRVEDIDGTGSDQTTYVEDLIMSEDVAISMRRQEFLEKAINAGIISREDKTLSQPVNIAVYSTMVQRMQQHNYKVSNKVALVVNEYNLDDSQKGKWYSGVLENAVRTGWVKEGIDPKSTLTREDLITGAWQGSKMRSTDVSYVEQKAEGLKIPNIVSKKELAIFLMEMSKSECQT